VSDDGRVGSVRGGTHSPGWYQELLDSGEVRLGEPLLIRCTGGPSISRFETFPPPLEIQERGGLYVLDDEGPVYRWRYEFVPRAF
jgi:hypothetical protein